MATIEGALSATKYLGTRITFYESSYNIANNTSVVHVNAYILSMNKGYGSCTTTRPFSVTVNGETKSVSVPAWNIVTGEVWLVGSFDFTVPHNNDGTKTIAISSSYNTGVANLGSSSLSGSLVLTTIPRASTVTCSDFYIENPVTINIRRANNTFRHTLKYNFGNLSETIVEKTEAISYQWMPDASLFYTQVLDSMSKTGTIVCETYNGNTKIGESSCNFTAKIEREKNVPEVTLKVIDINEKTIGLTGSENILVKYFSDIEASITATPKNGSSIKKYQLNDKDVEAVTVIPNIETNMFIAKAIDARGSELVGISEQLEKEWIEYVKLAFKSINVERENPTSDQIILNIEGFYFPNSFGLEANQLTLKVRFKEERGEWSEFLNITPNINAESKTFTLSEYNLSSLFENFNYQKSYVFQFYLEDKLMTVEKEIMVNRGQPVITYGENFVHIYGDLEVDNHITSGSGSISGSIIVKRWEGVQ
ncbi:MAG: hypothetical protein HFH08_04410 [Bacilli bacterium]|nr:hypothetical protein [Bacilli bacterium]